MSLFPLYVCWMVRLLCLEHWCPLALSCAVATWSEWFEWAEIGVYPARGTGTSQPVCVSTVCQPVPAIFSSLLLLFHLFTGSLRVQEYCMPQRTTSVPVLFVSVSYIHCVLYGFEPRRHQALNLVLLVCFLRRYPAASQTSRTVDNTARQSKHSLSI